MKRIAILLLAIFVAAGAAVAQDGLYVGAEVDSWYLSEFGDTMGINAYIGYELEVIENLDVFGEFSLYVPIGKFAGTFAELGLFDENKIFTVLEIGGKYNISNIFFGASLEMLLFHGSSYIKSFDVVELNFMGGYETDNFGIEATLHCALKPSEADFLQVFELYGFYSFGKFVPGLTLLFPVYEDGMDVAGFTLMPELTYKITDNFDFYVKFAFQGIGSDDDDAPYSGLTIGAKYNF